MSKYLSMKLEDAVAANNIAKVIQYLQKAEKENVVMSCVCVMHVLDDVIKAEGGLNERQMQSLGLITNIEQWKTEVNHNLQIIYRRPRMQTELKRLQRGFERMYEAWRRNKLKNSTLNEFLNKLAVEQLFQLWNNSQLQTENKENFISRVKEGYVIELETLKNAWVSGKVEEEFKTSLTLLDAHIAKAFVREWNNHEIVDSHMKEIIFQYGKSMLLGNLKTNQLPETLNNFILDDIGHHFYSLIANRKLSKLSLLGSKIECIKDSEFSLDNKSAYMEAVGRTLLDWVNDDIEGKAKEQLEEIVEEYFPKLVKNMSELELSSFRSMGVKSLLEQMRLNSLDELFSAKLKSFGQENVHFKLRLMNAVEISTADDDTRVLQEDITKKVIRDVRHEWQSYNAASSINEETKQSSFIPEQGLFQELKALDSNIQKIVYPAAIKASMSKFFEHLEIKENTVKGEVVPLTYNYNKMK